MASSQIEGIVEQVRGRDVDLVAPKGRGKKEVSGSYGELGRSSGPLRGRYGGHQRRGGHYGAKHEEGLGGSQGADPRPSRGHARLASPGGVTEEFTRVLDMLAGLESRVEVLTKHEEELR